MSSPDYSNLAALREQFDRDGYLALTGYFSRERIDMVLAAIARLIEQRPREVVVDNLATGQRTFWADADGRETRRFKFNDFYLLSPEVRELALDKDLSELLALLLREPAVLCNSLNFQKGSNQPKHIDSLYMTPQTDHALIATWTAFEDAHPDSGPLVYYPGSHKIPLFRFKDGTPHAGPGEMPAWTAYIEAQMKERGIPEKIFLAKKGDVFIWHSDLVHGGGAINDQNRTRNSLVCHYYGEADCRKLNCDLAPLHRGYWMRRLRQSVTLPPESFTTGGRVFPEKEYLERYPDVKAAVVAGTMPSGWVHYQAAGFKEGRGV